MPTRQPSTRHRFHTIPPRNTTAAGYGHEHQQERARRLKVTSPTDPCGYCRRPLGPDTHAWHLPHNPQRTGYLPGMWHATCNRRDGARRGAAKANTRKQHQRRNTRNW